MQNTLQNQPRHSLASPSALPAAGLLTRPTTPGPYRLPSISAEVRCAAGRVGQADQSRTEAVCAPADSLGTVRADMHSASTQERAGRGVDLPVWCSAGLLPLLSAEPP